MSRSHHGKGSQESAPRKRKPRHDSDNEKQVTVFEDVDAPIRPVTEKKLQAMQHKAERRKKRLESKIKSKTASSGSAKSLYKLSEPNSEKLVGDDEEGTNSSVVSPFTASRQWKTDAEAVATQSCREKKFPAIVSMSPNEKGRRYKRRSRKDSCKKSLVKASDELPTPIIASREVVSSKSSSEIFSSSQVSKEKLHDAIALELDKTWPDEEENVLSTQMGNMEVEDATQSDREVGKH